MRSLLKFIINVLLLVGIIWLLMKFTPVGDWVRNLWAKRTGSVVTTINGSGEKIDSSCQTPWGVKIPNGSTIFAYKDLVPTKDGRCEEEVRNCKRGELDGSYEYPSCLEDSKQPGTGVDQQIPNDGVAPVTTSPTLPANGASCETPRGQTIKHGNYIVSYQSPSSCTFQRRMCVDGTLLGQFQYNYCILPMYASSQDVVEVVAADSSWNADSWDTSPYAVGSAWQYAQVAYGGVDATQTLPSDYWNQNEKGSVAVVSSSNTKPAPTKTYAPEKDTSSTAYYDLTQKGCTTPWNTHVEHGQYVIAYKSGTPAQGRACEYERRVCNYGTLYGTFTESKCTVAGKTYTSTSWAPGNEGELPEPQIKGAACRLPWGGYIADGSYVKAFRNAASSYSDGCQGEYRFCRNGVLDGSYGNKSCSLVYAKPSSCVLPRGGSIADGQTIRAYSSPSGSCYSQLRTCSDGYLNGSYQYSYCTPQQASSCVLPRGGSIADGQTIRAYSSPSGNCTSQLRTCSNGYLNGSYQYSYCTPQQASSCALPRGGSIADGQTIRAYSTPSGNCTSQIRTCSDGYLNGSYQYSYCNNDIPQPTTLDDIYGSWKNVGRLDEPPASSVDTCDGNFTGEYTCSLRDAKTCVDYKKVEDDCCITGRAKYEKREITCR